jgi:hypothetical protein
VFSIRSVQSGYKEDNWGDPVQLKVESPAVKKGVHFSDIRPKTTMWAQEAEEYLLLEAVARERLLTTQQAEKRLGL